MENKIKIAIAFAVIAITPSCKDSDDTCVAGTGGNITMVLRPKHHGKAVRPYEAWLKYNTEDAPGASKSNYDLVVPADTTEDHVRLANMKCGDYYIYMHRYDTTIVDSVKGGIPFTVAEGTSGEVEVTVPVSED